MKRALSIIFGLFALVAFLMGMVYAVLYVPSWGTSEFTAVGLASAVLSTVLGKK